MKKYEKLRHKIFTPYYSHRFNIFTLLSFKEMFGYDDNLKKMYLILMLLSSNFVEKID